MTAREYIEAVAQELSRARGKGLLLSPADAALALSWHAAQVPLQAVVAEVRKAARQAPVARGALPPMLSLQQISAAVEAKAVRKPRPAAPRDDGLSAQLKAAARFEGLAARKAWLSLADRADELLSRDGAEGYWSAAVGALLSALRELPRSAALKAGAALRSRIAPRPRGMPRDKYRRSLQLMLLSAASEQIGVPPKAFLL
ncbi:MAG TPA: hypothetical protein VLW85_21435 [Myxococcales bacterium]|nr:hypothetical protein [Myxococcales bacterium]